MEKINPKALNLNTLDQIEYKVTLGFRCSANLKLRLAISAQDYGLSLSEYVESSILNFETIKDENENLKKRLSFYENEFLKTTFLKFKNTNVKFKDSKGIQKSHMVNTINDIYTIILQTVKV